MEKITIKTKGNNVAVLVKPWNLMYLEVNGVYELPSGTRFKVLEMAKGERWTYKILTDYGSTMLVGEFEITEEGAVAFKDIQVLEVGFSPEPLEFG